MEFLGKFSMVSVVRILKGSLIECLKKFMEDFLKKKTLGRIS